MRREADGHTLDALYQVNEAWLRLNAERFTSRSAFVRAAAVAMRRMCSANQRNREIAGALESSLKFGRWATGGNQTSHRQLPGTT